MTLTEESASETSYITKKRRRKKLEVTNRKRERNQISQFLRERAKPISIYVEDNKLIGKKIKQVRKNELNIIAEKK